MEGTMGSLRLLLVEDDLTVRELAAHVFRGEGYEVIEARTGDEAAQKLVDPGPIHMLFADVRLPGKMDGIDVALRARELHPHIAMVIVSAYAPRRIERLARLDPPAAYLQKPYRTKEILEVVRRLAS
jgi:two-component system, response regulator PdtaR